MQKALPLFNDNGSYLSQWLHRQHQGVFRRSAVYSASKALVAVRSFARTWLLELKERRIRRLSILSPGTIDTPILDPLGEEAKEFFKSQIPRGEMGRPEEIATVALFLASSDSSFVNGIELFVDGGTRSGLTATGTSDISAVQEWESSRRRLLPPSWDESSFAFRLGHSPVRNRWDIEISLLIS